MVGPAQIPAKTPVQLQLDKLSKMAGEFQPRQNRAEQQQKQRPQLGAPLDIRRTDTQETIEGPLSMSEALSERFDWYEDISRKMERTAKSLGEKALSTIASVPIPESLKQAAAVTPIIPGSLMGPKTKDIPRGLELGQRIWQAYGGLAGPPAGIFAEYGVGQMSSIKGQEIAQRFVQGGFKGEKEIVKDIWFNRQKASEVGSLIKNLLSRQISPRQFAGQLIEVQESKAFWDQLISEVSLDIGLVSIPTLLNKIPNLLGHMAQGRPRQTIIKAAQEATEAAPDKPIIEGIFRIIDEDEPRRALPTRPTDPLPDDPIRYLASPEPSPKFTRVQEEARQFDSAESFVDSMYIEPSYSMTPGVTRLSREYPITGKYHGTDMTAMQDILDSGLIKAKVSSLDRARESVVSVSGNKHVANSYGIFILELDPKLRVYEPAEGIVQGPGNYKGFEFRHPRDIPLSSVRSVTINHGAKEGLHTTSLLNPELSIGDIVNQLEAKGIKTYVADFSNKENLSNIWNQGSPDLRPPTTRPIYQGPTPGETNIQRFEGQVSREKLRAIVTGRPDTIQRLTDDGRIIIEDPEGNELFELLKSDEYADPRLRDPKYRGERAREGRNVALGKKALLKRLKMEVDLHGLDKEVADIATKWINMLPSKYLADLGSSFVQHLDPSVKPIDPRDRVAGFYRPVDPRNIFSESRDPTRGIITIGRKIMQENLENREKWKPERAIIHETMHHLYRLVDWKDIEDLRSQLDRDLAPGGQGFRILEQIRKHDIEGKAIDVGSEKNDYKFRNLIYRYNQPKEGDTQFGEWFAEVMTDKAMRDIFMQMPEYRNIIQKVLDHIKAIARAIREYIRTIQGRPDYAERVYQKIIKGDYSAAERRTIRNNIMREDPYLLTSIEDIDPKRIGQTTRATGADPNKVYDFEYIVAELDDLIPSHTDALAPNPQYTKELQPRMRERAAGRSQVANMAQRLNPDALLTETGTLDRGPMIIGPDMMVESGNGRILALRKARADFADNYNEYTKALSERLSEFGLSDDALEGMTNPVLVRKRLSEVDRVQFTAEANQSSVLSMAPVEQAVQDAQRLPDDVLARFVVGTQQNIDQALGSAANRPIIHDFMNTLPANETAALMTDEATLSLGGIDRIKGALFAKIFPGEAGVRLTKKFFESIDNEIKTIQNAILDAMPDLVRAEGLVSVGQRAGDLSIGDNLARVIDQFAALKQANILVTDFLQQSTMLERALNPLEEKLLLHFSRIQGRRNILRDFLRKYSTSVENSPDPQQVLMFPGDPVTKESIIDNIIAGQRQEFNLPDTMFDFVPPPVRQVAEEVAAAPTGPVTPVVTPAARQVTDLDNLIKTSERGLLNAKRRYREATTDDPGRIQQQIEDIKKEETRLQELTRERKRLSLSLLNARDSTRMERLPRLIKAANKEYQSSRYRVNARDYEEKQQIAFSKLQRLEQELANLERKVRPGVEEVAVPVQEAVATIREVDVTAMSTEQLKTWYKRLGFKFRKGDDWGSLKNPMGIKRALEGPKSPYQDLDEVPGTVIIRIGEELTPGQKVVKALIATKTNNIKSSLQESGGYSLIQADTSVEFPGRPSQSGMLIFDANNQPVLFVDFQVSYMDGSLGDVLRINNINVHPAYRREGIGSTFMRNLINSAQQENLSVHLKAGAGEGFIPQSVANQWVRNADTPVQIDEVTGENLKDVAEEIEDVVSGIGGGGTTRPPTTTGAGGEFGPRDPIIRTPRTLADMNREAKGMRAMTPEQRAAVMDEAKPIEGEILYEHQPFNAAADRLLNPVETGTTRTAREIGKVISKALNIPGGPLIRKALQLPAKVWSPANIVRDDPIAMIGLRRAMFVEIETARIRLAVLNWWDDAKAAFKFRQTGTMYGVRPWTDFWASIYVQASEPRFSNNKMFGTINDMIEHPERYVFTPEQSRVLKIATDMLTKAVRDAQRAGVDVVELAGDYWPRIIRSGPNDKWWGKRNLGSLRQRVASRKGYTHQRVFGDIDDLVGSGYAVHTDPRRVIVERLEAGINTIADQEVRKQIAGLPGVRKPREILSEKYPEVLINAEAARVARDIAKDVVKQAKDNVTRAEVNALRQAEADYISSMREVFAKRVETNQPGYTELRLPNGRIAPQEMVDDINKLIDLPELRNARPGAIAEFTRDFSHMLRTTLTNVDLAAGYIQGQFTFYRNPRAWAIAQAKSIMALIDDPTAYVKENWDVMNEANDMGAISMPTEFLFARQGMGSWPTKIPIVGPIMRGFNRAFEWFITIAQTELYKAARTGQFKYASVEELVSLASAIRKSVGTESYAILGVRPTQQTIEALSLFSARFFRATAGLIGQSFTGGPGGAEARKALFALMGGGMALLLGISAAQDRRLPNLTDPYAPDWFQVRVGKSYFTPFFSMYPWFRTIARMGVQVEQGNFNEARKEGSRFLKSKASIPFRVLNVAGQLQFYGQARVYDNVIEKSWIGVPMGILEEYAVPISIQDFIQDPLYWRDRPEALVDPLGIMARPIVLYTEWRKEIEEFQEIPSDKDLKQGETSRTDTRKENPLLEAKLFITETRNMSAFVGWNLEKNPITSGMRMTASLIITHDVDYRSIKAIADRLEIRRKHIEEGKPLKVNSIDMLLYEIQRKQQQVEELKERTTSQNRVPQQQTQEDKSRLLDEFQRQGPTRTPVGVAP